MGLFLPSSARSTNTTFKLNEPYQSGAEYRVSRPIGSFRMDRGNERAFHMYKTCHKNHEPTAVRSRHHP